MCPWCGELIKAALISSSGKGKRRQQQGGAGQLLHTPAGQAVALAHAGGCPTYTYVQVNATLFTRIMWAKGFGGAPQDDNEHKWAERKEFLPEFAKWQTFAKYQRQIEQCQCQCRRTCWSCYSVWFGSCSAQEGHDLGAWAEQGSQAVRQLLCQPGVYRIWLYYIFCCDLIDCCHADGKENPREGNGSGARGSSCHMAASTYRVGSARRHFKFCSFAAWFFAVEFKAGFKATLRCNL